MISLDSLEVEHIKEISKANQKANITLIDKVIRALLLLEGLSEAGLEFVFKGGTAVMLLQVIPKRFSIDIDIVMSSVVDFDSIFSKFYSEKGFSHFEIQPRKSTLAINKFHYKFFYLTVVEGVSRQENVILDILIEDSPYKDVRKKEISSPFVKQTSPTALVSIPSLEDLLGDKLTAFAPNTTGIPYVKNESDMGMEIIKQLYDIGNLFEKIENLETVAHTFHHISQAEIKYRGLNIAKSEILDDIVGTALCISTQGVAGAGKFDSLLAGISRLRSYIYSERFLIEKAIVFAARAAYCATLIKKEKKEFIRYSDPKEVSEWEIKQPSEIKLNKLKKNNPEAFFYWYQTHLIQH